MVFFVISCLRGCLLASSLLVPAAPAAAQDHTLVVLSHSNHTVYELDPASGRILHEFVAPDQPHEGAITSDGATVFASVPAASFVEILYGKTFKEKGRIESEYFKRPPQPRAAGRNGGPPPPPNTSASPHGMALGPACPPRADTLVGPCDFSSRRQPWKA